MKLTDAALELLKKSEGYSENVYNDSAGLPTIGYGHLLKAGETYTTIDESTAETLLRNDLQEAENAVKRLVKAPLNDNQYSALVLFVFNIGSGNFQKSTMLKLLNKSMYYAAAQEFDRWNKAGGKVVKGLITRRAAEKALFQS